MAWAIFAGIFLFTGLLAITAIIFILAWRLLHPPRLNDARAVWRLKRISPSDIGLESKDSNFRVRDESTGEEIEIAGWWIAHPQSNSRTIVLLHAYADAKIGAIAWAPTIYALGWNILAIDLRAHGQSGGKFTTGAVRERYDVSQVIDQLRAERPIDARHIAILGLSSGAAIAAAVAAMRDDIAAVILDSIFPDLEIAVGRCMAINNQAGPFLNHLAIQLAKRLAGVKLSDVRPLDLIPKIRCPALIIVGDSDPLIRRPEVDQLQSALASRNNARDSMWIPPETGHLMAIVANPDEYQRRVGEFLGFV